LEEGIELINPDDVNDILSSANVTNIINEFTIEVSSSEFSLSNKTLLKKIIKKSNFLNYPDINDSPANIQNTYIDNKKEYLYVAASGLPNYRVTSNDRKVLFSTSAGTGTTTIVNTNIKHRFYTGEKVFVSPNGNIGIDTGAYFITTVGNYEDSTQVSFSYSDGDLYSKKYIVIPSGLSTAGNFVKFDYENKKVEHQKLLKKFKLSKEDPIFEVADESTTNNKPIGLLLNGVELYSNTLYDENIYYGKLDKIDVISSGSGYDVVNSPELVIADNTGINSKAHFNISGSIVDVKILDIGNGYTDDLKVSLTGGNGSNAILKPNVIKTQIISAFRADSGDINPTDNSVRFRDNHNFDNGDQVEYLSNSNIEIKYRDPITNEDRSLSINSLIIFFDLMIDFSFSSLNKIFFKYQSCFFPIIGDSGPKIPSLNFFLRLFASEYEASFNMSLFLCFNVISISRKNGGYLNFFLSLSWLLNIEW